MASPLTLLTLPGEIREQIWTAILHADNNLTEHPDHCDDCDDPSAWWTFDLRIFRTSRQIYDETQRVFKRINTFVKVTAPWEEAVENTKKFARTPVLCRGDVADRFTGYQMSCLVDSPVMGARLDGHSFIVDAKDMLGFCRMWYYFDLSHDGLNGHLRLRLTLTGLNGDPEVELPKALQRRLLAPWGLVRHLDSLIVEGPHDNAIVEDLRKAMTEAYPTPVECLQLAETRKEAGNAAFKAEKYALALSEYIEAFKAIHIQVDGKRRHIWAEGFFQVILPTHLFQGMHGGHVYMQLRIQLVANTVFAYYKLEDFDMAFFWGMRSINIMRQFPDADEPRFGFPGSNQWGKIYYRTALAAKALGRMEEARELVKIAARWLPEDVVVQRERARWGNLQLG